METALMALVTLAAIIQIGWTQRQMGREREALAAAQAAERALHREQTRELVDRIIARHAGDVKVITASTNGTAPPRREPAEPVLIEGLS